MVEIGDAFGVGVLAVISATSYPFLGLIVVCPQLLQMYLCFCLPPDHFQPNFISWIERHSGHLPLVIIEYYLPTIHYTIKGQAPKGT